MQQSYHPSELFALARDAHMPNLPEDQQKMLAARVVGMSYDEIGDRVAMDARAVRKAVNVVERAVAHACGLYHRDSFLTALFFCLHAECDMACTSTGMRFLREGGAFSESVS